MNNYCPKCGKKLNVWEKEGHCNLEEYGMVCELCYEASVMMLEKEGAAKAETGEQKAYDSYFTGAALVADGVKNLLSDEKNYSGASGKAWIKYLKLCQYIVWIIITLAGFVVGWNVGSWDGISVLTSMLFGGIFFIAGFMMIAVTMVFITMAENIAKTTDMTAEILNEVRGGKS